MYYNIPAASFCCLCYKNLLPTGPNWLAQATFVGVTKYNLTNMAANLWTFSNNTQFYYETAANRRTSPMILLLLRACTVVCFLQHASPVASAHSISLHSPLGSIWFRNRPAVARRHYRPSESLRVLHPLQLHRRLPVLYARRESFALRSSSSSSHLPPVRLRRSPGSRLCRCRHALRTRLRIVSRDVRTKIK